MKNYEGPKPRMPVTQYGMSAYKGLMNRAPAFYRKPAAPTSYDLPRQQPQAAPQRTQQPYGQQRVHPIAQALQGTSQGPQAASPPQGVPALTAPNYYARAAAGPNTRRDAAAQPFSSGQGTWQTYKADPVPTRTPPATAVPDPYGIPTGTEPFTGIPDGSGIPTGTEAASMQSASSRFQQAANRAAQANVPYIQNAMAGLQGEAPSPAKAEFDTSASGLSATSPALAQAGQNSALASQTYPYTSADGRRYRIREDGMAEFEDGTVTLQTGRVSGSMGAIPELGIEGEGAAAQPSYQDLPQAAVDATPGVDQAVVERLRQDGWVPMRQPDGTYTMVWGGKDDRADWTLDPTSPYYMETVARMSREGGSDEGAGGMSEADIKSFLDSLFGGEPGTIPQADIDAQKAADARTRALESSRMMRAAMIAGANAGAPAEAVSAGLSQSGRELGVYGAQQDARTQLQYGIQNAQAEMEHWRGKLQAALVLAGQSHDVRMQQLAASIAQDAQARLTAAQRNLMKYQAELSSPSLGESIFGAIGSGLGSLANGLSFGLGNWLFGGGGGEPLDTLIVD